MTASTLCYTASTTKAFTAAIVALLIDDSVNSSDPLTWLTPVSSIIRDDFVLPDEYATAHVTIEDALSHRTGMPRHDGSYGGLNWTVRDVARSLRHLPMTGEIRQKWQYCNMMYMTMSHVIETLTGRWLGDLLRERIWEPLSMTNTYFSLDQAQDAVDAGVASIAQGYVFNNLTKEYLPVRDLDMTAISGAGATISNVLDYAKWLHFLIDKAPPLSEAGHNSLRRARIPLEMPHSESVAGVGAYALGWELLTYRGEPLITHDGGLPGFGTRIGYLPRKRWGFALMANTAGTSNVIEEVLSNRLLDDKLGIPEEDREGSPSWVEDMIKERAERLRNPRKYLYPDAPSGKDVIPLARHLEAYTGVYHHPGYQNITIRLVRSSELKSVTHSKESKERLQVTSEMKAWPVVLDFVHVSGEYFILYGYMDLYDGKVDMDDPLQIETFKAEFRIGENGEVSEFGAALEAEMGGEKIWFKRIG